MRFSSLSCGSTLRTLGTIFQPELQEHAPLTTFLYLKAAIFKPELPRTRGESNPRPRDCESRRANHETTSKGRSASKNIARRHSESASTRTISAEGSPRLKQIRKAPQRERCDVHDLRRGSRAASKNRKKSSVLEPRPRESPQRVARAHRRNSKKSSVFEPRPRESPQRVAIPSDDQTPAPAP